MPLYELECPNCGLRREAILAIDAESPLCICGTKTTKLIGSLAFFISKDEPQGSTTGIRKKAEELTRKYRNK